METKKENNTPPPSQPAPPAGTNIPEWVMHLLTGLGTMGAEYMLFIKPLQEKMELQSQLIKEQGERIEELEALLSSRKKQKLPLTSGNEEEDGDEDEERDTELFQVSRKPDKTAKYNKHMRLKL